MSERLQERENALHHISPQRHRSEEKTDSGVSAPDAIFGPTAVLTPANVITFARVAAIPPFIYLILTYYYGAVRWWILALWIAIMTSDLADGFLARRQGTTTSGAYLDPLADKFAVLGSLSALAWLGKVNWIAVVIMATRELAVSVFRSYASRRRVTIPATPFGKAKTLSQSIAIGLILLPSLDPYPLVAHIAVWIAVGFTVASGLDYLRRGSGYLLSDKIQEQPPVDHGSIESAIRGGRDDSCPQVLANPRNSEEKANQSITRIDDFRSNSESHKPSTSREV